MPTQRLVPIILLMTVLGYALAGAAQAPKELQREDLGHRVKFTCVVDKVMQPENQWITQEWMVREAAEAGFNIYSPRTGHDKLDAVRRVTAWCEQYGIFHLPWMRGTLGVSLDDPRADGKRMVWANGGEQALWSPNSDEFWEWTTKYIVEYAKMSAENDHIIGVFLDYENYAPGPRLGNAYSLSYDNLILNRFAEHAGVELPELPLDERASWLKEQGLHDRFEAFQIAEWRARCRALRQTVDQYDPKFQFWLYPVPGTPFLREAAYYELATQAAPIVIADQNTYGRPSAFLPEQESLERNRQKLLKYQEIPKTMGIPHLYAGGIDPIVRGADPEFCGKNAVMISEVTDGYWVFYEGPTYKEDHPEYWKWFAWANQAIAEGRFDAQHAPRETDEAILIDLFQRIGKDGFAAPESVGTQVDFPLHKLRGANLLLIGCEAGREVVIGLRDVPLGNYTDPLTWELRMPGFEKLNTGTIAHDESGAVRFTPEATGIFFLGLSSGSCSYAVTNANAPLGLHAGDYLGTVHGAQRLYCYVPASTKAFTVRIKGSGAETVRVNVYGPDGEERATGQTTPNSTKADVSVNAENDQDAVWSLALVKADAGTLEDAGIKVEGIPPVLCMDPKHMFRPSG